MPWLDEIVAATRESESPERYYWWASLAAVSAVVKDRVYLDRFTYTLYPNIYVLLVSARSGLRKGIPISFARKMVSEVANTRLISGRNTIQGVIKELSVQRTLESGAVLSDAQGILLSDEFAIFLQNDPEALTILTSLHNTHEHHNSPTDPSSGGWTNTLKNSPVEVLKNPCLTLLGASNEKLFDDIVKGKDMEGGFIARTFIVYEEKRRCINPLTTRPKDFRPPKEFAKYLRQISELSGEFTLTEQATHTYNKWYRETAELEERGVIEDKTGSLERIGDQVLKVSMLLTLANSLKFKITEKYIEEAIVKSEECIIQGVAKITVGAGDSELGPAYKKVIAKLNKAPDRLLTRQQLLQRIYPDVDSILLDKTIDTLVQAGVIKSTTGKGGVIYQLTDKVDSKQIKDFLGL